MLMLVVFNIGGIMLTEVCRNNETNIFPLTENVVLFQNGWTPLIMAAIYDHHDIVKALVSSGASIDLDDYVSI